MGVEAPRVRVIVIVDDAAYELLDAEPSVTIRAFETSVEDRSAAGDVIGWRPETYAAPTRVDWHNDGAGSVARVTVSVADAGDMPLASVMTADERIERLMARRDRWVAVATEARIERNAAIARAEKAEAERDEARRILLALADGLATLNAHRALQRLDDALGLTHASYSATAAALRKLCGVSDG